MVRPLAHSFWTIAFAAFVPLAAGTVSLIAAPALNVAAGLEPGEDMPGGAATSRESVTDRDAFSHFSHGIGFEGEARFKVGNAIFRKLWVAAPSSTKASDGLGPLSVLSRRAPLQKLRRSPSWPRSINPR